MQSTPSSLIIHLMRPHAHSNCYVRHPPCSVVLWRRSDSLVFVLVLGGASGVVVGTGVECKIKGILQVGARLCV